MSTKKQKRIGQKVGNVAAWLQALSIVVISGLCILMFSNMTTDIIQAECTDGTNMLAYEIQKDPTGDMDRLLNDLKVNMGYEFAIYEGRNAAYSTVPGGGSAALPDVLASQVLQQGQNFLGKVSFGSVKYLCSCVPMRDSSGQITGVLLAGLNEKEVSERIDLTGIIVASVVATVVLIVLGILIIARYLTKEVSRPLARLTDLAKTMEQGELGLNNRQQLVVDIRSNDEIGVLAESFSSTIERLRSYIGEISSVLGSVAGGDLTVEPQQNYIGDFSSIKTSMEAIIAKLGETMAQIVSSAEQVSAGADQMSSGAQALSQGAMEQASTLEGLKDTIDGISAQIGNSAKSAKEANEQSSGVGVQIQESNQKMQEMITAMREINTSSNEIGKIIKAIEDIAFQTNILALNAAVEAARAGAAGKGFAVVADEVRNLASKSADASKSTSALIESSLAAVEKGTRIANETATQLDRVVLGASQVIDSINIIAKAAQEQADAVAQVQTQISEISDVVTTNSATAEESAATSEELSAQARMLEEMTSSFRLRN